MQHSQRWSALRPAWCWHPGLRSCTAVPSSTLREAKMSKRINRRDFLKVAAVAAGAAAATRAAGQAAASETGSHGPHQWVMVIDQSKCIGCGYCTSACQAHNDVNPEIEWNHVEPAGQVNGEDVF